jgi:hypothetical protein
MPLNIKNCGLNEPLFGAVRGLKLRALCLIDRDPIIYATPLAQTSFLYTSPNLRHFIILVKE